MFEWQKEIVFSFYFFYFLFPFLLVFPFFFIFPYTIFPIYNLKKENRNKLVLPYYAKTNKKLNRKKKKKILFFEMN